MCWTSKEENLTTGIASVMIFVGYWYSPEESDKSWCNVFVTVKNIFFFDSQEHVSIISEHKAQFFLTFCDGNQEEIKGSHRGCGWVTTVH